MKVLKIAVAGACLALMAACGIGGNSDGATVGVKLDEYKLQLASTSIPAGKVTFQISNEGKEKHEFVILRTDLALMSLPIDTSANKVQEEATGIVHVDEIDGLGPGEQKNLALNMKPGRYLLVCNYPGHVHGGMVAVFEVK